MKKLLVMSFMLSLLIVSMPATEAQGYDRGYDAGYNQAYENGYRHYERQARDRKIKHTLRNAAIGAGAGYFFSGRGHKVGNSLLGGGIGAAFTLLK